MKKNSGIISKFRSCLLKAGRSPVKDLIYVAILIAITSLKALSQTHTAIDNPVLPGVADAGVIKYNGEYYIGGVFTNGSFYTSKDLVKWSGPVHVFSMDNDWTEGPSAGDNQIHANDIHYINGVFHMYWSVNYWGKDRNVIHIGHATSPNILGPYKEPVTATWLTNRIDPELFIDDDGKLYLYMVKFTDGNTIWVRPMHDPGTFSGEPKYVFSSLPGTWETRDNRVEEGPWVIKYRNKYYLMYNSNHTSPSWGNYALGVAEADAPLEFNHGNKYPYPVVKSNQLDMEDTYVDLLKYTAEGPGNFRYTSEQPGENWKSVKFDAAAWQKGKAGFGSEVIKNSTTRQVKTPWKTPQIWVRKSFIVDKKNTGNLMLRMHHDGDTEAFLNGESVYKGEGSKYSTWNFDKKATSFLKDGENVLAIHSIKGDNSNFLDASLFDMKNKAGDDILFSPGQPNLLRGPNGFEWWLVYMANKNADKRGQYINRVYFFDKTLAVDGLTSTHTPGYHPAPAPPTFADLFDEENAGQWQTKWEPKNGRWNLQDKELLQTENATAQALVKSSPATHYLFEAGVKMNNPTTAKAGIYAWWQDENNWLKVLLDQEHKQWAYILKAAGAAKTIAYPLPSGFNYNVYHTIGVYKNGAGFTVKIDDLPAPGNPLIQTDFSGKGIPGLYTEGANTAFDGVLYTIGWDEFDNTITGWEPSAKGAKQKGAWAVAENGISQAEEAGESAIFKGDALDAYELSLQVSAADNKGSAGLYPVYVDANNYLKAAFDFKNQRFIVSGKKGGKAIKTKEASLQRSKSYYADMKYTDFFEKHFTFSTPTYINAIRFNKTPHLMPDTTIEDIYKKVDVFYKRAGKWYPLTSFREVPSAHPAFDKIAFDPVEVEEIKLVNKEATDQNFYFYKIWVDEVFRQSYNLRVSKLAGAIIFFANGEEVLRMKNDYAASQVGLFTENTKARFNGITLFQLANSHSVITGD